jgi:hypothetical protein
MKKAADPLTELLNKVAAICETCGRGTYAQLAESLGKTPRQIVSWLTLRDHEPGGRIAIQMEQWAAQKTLEISERNMGDEYQKQFLIACLKFPLNGKR